MIKDLEIYKNNFFKDNRGYFKRIFCKNHNRLRANNSIKQINFSHNAKKYTLRGMHFQKGRYSEGKYFHVINGKLQLIVVDLRKKSKTFKNVENIILGSNKCTTVYIPPGCANGFLTLNNNTNVIYAMTNFFNEKSSDGFNFKSKLINKLWLKIPLIVSNKDKALKKL